MADAIGDLIAANPSLALPQDQPKVLDQSIDSALDGLDSDAFLQLFVAQMQYQNPLEPTGGAEMMMQTAQFSQVELLQRVVDMQQDLMGVSQISTATSLVGQNVTSTLPGVGEVSGIVEGFSVTADGPMLQIDGHEVPLSAIGNVAAADEFEEINTMLAQLASTPAPAAAAPPTSAGEAQSDGQTDAVQEAYDALASDPAAAEAEDNSAPIAESNAPDSTAEAQAGAAATGTSGSTDEATPGEEEPTD